MKRWLIGSLLWLTACGESPPKELSGYFEEAKEEEQSLTIAVGKELVSFRIEGAECLHMDELQPGSPVRIQYRKLARQGATPALRVEVDPTYNRLLGRWIEVGPDAAYGMGIELAPKGNAYSIGMQTLIFRAWQLTPQGEILLSGHSLGNGQSLSFSEEWRIQHLSSESLILAQEDLTLRFRRENEADQEERLKYEAQRNRPTKR
ncbi:MAG: hypothetical protein IJX56_02015 [Alistipes sp.]|nr:hypothetical protein [Alistipes sp.]